MPDIKARPHNTPESSDVLAYPEGGASSESITLWAGVGLSDSADTFTQQTVFAGAAENDPHVGSSSIGAIIMHATDFRSPTFNENGNVWIQAVISGPEGAEVGLILFHGDLYDTYSEFRVKIGAHGQLFIRSVWQGLEVGRVSPTNACDTNSYSLPASTPITLRFCVTNRAYVNGDSCGDIAVLIGTADTGSNEYKVGCDLNYLFEPSFLIGRAPNRGGVAIARGVGVTVDDYRAEAAGWPAPCGTAVNKETCTQCDTCHLISSAGGGWVFDSLAQLTVDAGSWTAGASYIECTSSNGRVLLAETWIDDNLFCEIIPISAGTDLITGTPPFEFRYVFAYSSSLSKWFIEYGDDGTSRWTRIARTAGAGEVEYIWAPWWLTAHAEIFDCTAQMSVTWARGFGSCFLLDPGDLPKSGQVGFETGTVTDFVRSECVVSADCGRQQYCYEFPTDGEPPGDPTGCCSDLSALLVGQTIEASCNFASYYFGPECADITCMTSEFLTAYNANHVLTCVYRDSQIVLYYADLGIANPCEAECTVAGDGKIVISRNIFMYLWVIPVGGGQCQAFAEVGSLCRCRIKYESGTFATGSVCDGIILSPVGAGDGAKTCCLLHSGGNIQVFIP